MRYRGCTGIRASMTVEAALVLPILLWAFMNLTGMVSIYKQQAEVMSTLMKAGHTAAVAAAMAPGQDGDDGVVDLTVPFVAAPYAKTIGFRSKLFYVRYFAKAWTGYSGGYGQGNPDAETYVYLSATGTEVYHLRADCSYLNVRPKQVSQAALVTKRNSNGGRYKPCERCLAGPYSDPVYICEWGDRYHCSLDCSGLKRSVRKVTMGEAVTDGRRACSRCGGE